MVDFIFVDPTQNDLHSVKTLLKDYLEDHPFNVTEFAEIIVKQSNVGSMIKIEGDDEQSYGFISVINLHEYQVSSSFFTYILAYHINTHTLSPCFFHVKCST
jgi:protein BCP1